MADEVLEAYLEKYGNPPNHPNHLLQFSKSRRDLMTLNYSSSRQALSNYQQKLNQKKKKKKQKKPKLRVTKSNPAPKEETLSSPPELEARNSMPQQQSQSYNPPHSSNQASLQVSSTYNPPIALNQSQSPHTNPRDRRQKDSYNMDYKQNNTQSNSYDEPVMYDMDDTEEEEYDKTIVIDNGTSLLKIGYVGAKAPMTQFHPTQISKGRKLSKNPIERGIIVDTQKIEAVYNHTFNDILRLSRDDLSEYGVILNCAVFCPQDTAETLCEIMMETFGFAKFFISSSALLSLFGTQKVSGLVIESGSSLTQCVPIWNGCPVAQACKRVDVGGDDVDEYLRDLLIPKYKNAGLDLAICKQIKEQHGYIALDYRKEKSKRIEYRLPNGMTIKVGDERFKCGELLFSYLDRNSIDKQIYDSVMSCDVDIRKEMLNNIVISGGSTMMRGMQQRIKNDLVASCKSSKTKKIKKYAKKVNVIAPPNRNVLSWVGGSIFGGLPAFDQFWFTRDQYQEYGAVLSQKIEHSNIFFYDDYQPKELDLKEIQNYNQQYRRRTLSVYTYTGSMATPAKTGSPEADNADNIFPAKQKKSNPFPNISPGFGTSNPFASKKSHNKARANMNARQPPNKPTPAAPQKDIHQPNRTQKMNQGVIEENQVPDDDDMVKTYSEPWNDEFWDDDGVFERPRERSHALHPHGGMERVPESDEEEPEIEIIDDDESEPEVEVEVQVQVSGDQIQNNAVNKENKELRKEINGLNEKMEDVLLQMEDFRLEAQMLQKQNEALAQENKLLKHKLKMFEKQKTSFEKYKNELISQSTDIALEIASIQQLFDKGNTRLQNIDFDILSQSISNQPKNPNVETVTD